MAHRQKSSIAKNTHLAAKKPAKKRLNVASFIHWYVMHLFFLVAIFPDILNSFLKSHKR